VKSGFSKEILGPPDTDDRLLDIATMALQRKATIRAKHHSQRIIREYTAMNADASCHEIPDCPGLFVDAFRGRHLREGTRDAANAFVLTHYHGDHYGNLPRRFRYEGPASIHCTPVTARLLREVHEVPAEFVVEHPCGETWSAPLLPGKKRKGTTRSDGAGEGGVVERCGDTRRCARVTFYDANHCPGAAIVVVEVPTDDDDEDDDVGRAGMGKVHVHTGDMRYDRNKMMEYPLLKEAAARRRIDCVLLDTTYADPRHDFQPQEAAVDDIATQVHRLLLPRSPPFAPSNSSSIAEPKPKTLVLLSCYSIGKERVLWEASKRADQPVYVSERKLRMLQCIESNDAMEQSSPSPSSHACCNIVRRCTTDPTETDIHVVPMGLAGELWPFFRPNYLECHKYAKELKTAVPYSRVVAFIPTGWAECSNWNKKNAVCRRNCNGVDVEIRLVSYSEHSSYSELVEFVEFLNPRKVIPTVFKDEHDKRKIEARFPVDTGRAKQHFFKSMTKSASANHQQIQPRSPSPPKESLPSNIITSRKRKLPPQGEVRQRPHEQASDGAGLVFLEAMGFASAPARAALEACGGNVQSAVDSLLSSKGDEVRGKTATPSPSKHPLKRSPSSASSAGSKKLQEQRTLTSFFSRKL